MTDPDEKQRMAQLEDKIAIAKAVHRHQSQIEDHHSQMLYISVMMSKNNAKTELSVQN